jgi:hypothetical protein
VITAEVRKVTVTYLDILCGLYKLHKLHKVHKVHKVHKTTVPETNFESRSHFPDVIYILGDTYILVVRHLDT